jgi:hypothetical protein
MMEKRGLKLFLFGMAAVVPMALCNTGAAVTLQLKLAQGKTYYQRTVIDQHMVQTVMNMQQVLDQSLGTGVKMEVLDVDGQGNMRIRRTYDWSMTKRTGPMGNLDYDSAKQTTPPPGAEPFAALLGQSYVVRISPKGEVLEINGVEEMQAAVRKKLPAGAQGDPAMSVLSQFLDKNSLKQMIEGELDVYPGKPVEVGESWNKKRVVTPMFELTIDSKWTLQKLENGVAIIATTSTSRSDANKPVETGGMKMRFDLAGTQGGTIRMQEATGLILLGQAQQQLKGEIKLGDSDQGPPTMAIPVVFDTKVRMEMSDKPLEPATK